MSGRGRLFLLACFVCLGAVAESAGAAPEPPTDRYGDPLPDRAIARLGCTRLRHSATVTCLAFSPDGKTLASGARDGTLRLWDVATGKELRQFGDALGHLSAVVFTPDGKSLISASSSGHAELTLWEVRTGKPLRTFSGLMGVDHVALTPDGQFLAAADGGKVRIWNVANGREVNRFVAKSAFNALTFSPDGDMLALAANEGLGRPFDDTRATLYLWKWNTPWLPRPLVVPNERISALAFVNGGRELAYVGENAIATIDPTTGSEVGHQEVARRCDHALFSPKGDYMALGNWGSVSVREAATGCELCRIDDQLNWWSQEFAFSPDGKYLAWGGSASEVHIWDLAGRKMLHAFADDPGSDATLRFLNGGKQLALESWRYGVVLEPVFFERSGGRCTVRYGERRAAYPMPSPALSQLRGERARASPDGTTLAVEGINGLARLVSADTGEEHCCVGPSADNFRCSDLAFSADGKTVAADFSKNSGIRGEDRKHSVRLYDVTSGRLLATLDRPADQFVMSLEFSPRGDLLMVATPAEGTLDDTLSFWDVRTGNEVLPPNGAPRGDFFAFSPDGRLLAVGGRVGDNGPDGAPGRRERGIRVYELLTGQVAARFEPHPNERCCRFSPDGRTLANGAADGTIRLFDVYTGDELRCLHGHRGAVRSLDFAADGKVLGSSSADGTSLLWDVADVGSKAPRGHFTAAHRDALWSDLADQDAAKAHRAAGQLLHAANCEIGYLKARLHALPAADVPTIRRLLADLDSADFAVRDAALKSLTGQEHTAVPALRAALDEPLSLEVRWRVEKVLADADRPAASPERLRDLRALAILEQIGTAEARGILEAVAGGAPDARLTKEAEATLARLARR